MATPEAEQVLDTYHSLTTTFSDFLIVAIHTILYERAIYPAITFLSARKYNLPVRQNRHPKVCKWIMDAVAAVEIELRKGTVNRIAVVIYSLEAEPLERFMFDVSTFPEVPPGELMTEFDEGDAEVEPQGEKGPEINFVDVEEQLRATLRKLAYCGSKLGPLPKGCSYTVAVELKENADPLIGHPQPWIPSVPTLQTGEKGQSKRKGSDLGGVKSTPVRLVEAGAFVLEMWIEEGKAKKEDRG